MKLYTYWRSSAAYRVRIALNLKGLSADEAYVHLRKGDHRAAGYLAVNPQGIIPALVDGETAIGQSLAILEYLEETRPAPPLLPDDAAGRARVRQICLAIACELHPLNNLKVQTYLREEVGADPAAIRAWYHHWVRETFAGLETMLGAGGGEFCHGAVPTLADVCLVPQVYNARRNECDLEAYPNIVRIEQTCLQNAAFADAAPEAQGDAEATA